MFLQFKVHKNQINQLLEFLANSVCLKNYCTNGKQNISEKGDSASDMRVKHS